MRKIKIAQIGVNENSHSNVIFGSILWQKDLFDVVGYVLPENEKERLPDKADSLKKYPELTLDEVLSNPEIEAVTIETDEIYLTKYALMAAKAGKHIHMEKPGGISLTDFEELIRIMKKTGKVFHIGYMYRYNPYVIDLLNRVKNGELGEILSVEAQMNCYHPKKVRQWLEIFPGGMMFYLGCHLVDLILQLQGKPEKVIPYNKCTGFENVTSKDFGMALFEYKNGISFAKTSAVELGGFERRQLVVTGTKGAVELKPLEWWVPNSSSMQTYRNIRISSEWGEKGEEDICPPYDRYAGMMKSFAEYVCGVKENPYTLDYELELYRTILKCCGVDDE